MSNKIMIKSLLAATMLTAVTAGTAQATGTAAGTEITNQFTLDYKANDIDQTQIDNAADPTTFTVDRRVDLTTSAPGTDPTTTPGADDDEVVFTFVNQGNGESGTGDGADSFTFEVSQQSGGDFTNEELTVASYWVDDGAGPNAGNGVQDGDEPTVTYSGSVDLPPDVTVFVTATIDVPITAENGDSVDVLFTATAVDSEGDALEAAATNDLESEDIVLNDDAGETDSASDAIHTSVTTFTVEAPDLTATKEAAVVSEDGGESVCADFTETADTANEFAIPGACVEYTITIENAASAGGVTVGEATDLSFADILSEDLVLIAFQEDLTNGDDMGGDFGSLTIPPSGLSCDGTSATCNVTYTGGTLDQGETGIIVIRALVDAT